MPIIYDRAFGGTESVGAEAAQASEERNPVGRGFCASDKWIDGVPLPNVEDPAQIISTWRDRPNPIGLGALGRNWHPRRALAGTYDKKWRDDRFPYLPADFDERYFMSAPRDQWLERYEPGDRVAISNVSARELLIAVFPAFDMPVYARWEDRRQVVTLHPDTVLIEPDLDRLVLTCRVALPVGPKRRRLRQVIVGHLAHGEERAFVSGKRYLRAHPEDAELSEAE
jgi:hypothetical protein